MKKCEQLYARIDILYKLLVIKIKKTLINVRKLLFLENRLKLNKSTLNKAINRTNDYYLI